MPELRLGNFRLGQRADAALRDDAIISARTLENFSIIYAGESARLRIRDGYTRWNSNALGAPADQIYMFSDMEQNEHLLALYNGYWYEINQVAAHEQLIAVTATARRPILQFGNRCFFWTDDDGDGLSGYWTDDTQLGSAPKAFRLGIKKPDDGPSAATVAVPSHVPAPDGPGVILNTDTRTRYAIKLPITSTLNLGSMSIWIRRPVGAALAGNARISIFTDDGGEPSTTLADDLAVSGDWPVALVSEGLYLTASLFTFRGVFQLDPATYWAVISTDAAYKASYHPVWFYLDVRHDTGVAGDSMSYDSTIPGWVASNLAPGYELGGLDDVLFYDYVQTYANSTYGSESRPSEYVRVDPTAPEPAVLLTLPVPADGQVDKIRIYRRELTDITHGEGDITDTYKFLGEGSPGGAITDTVPTANLGAELQTTDHYCLDDTDDSGSGFRDAAILPKYAALWKGRLWMAEADSRILHFTKLLEENGATGLVGESAEDYVPLENKQEMPVPAGIIGLRPLSNDQLAVYFEDESVWLIYGGDEALNPPSDLIIREVLTTNGLIATAGIADMDGRHIYLGRDGLYAFAGTQQLVPEYLSETNQSILDAIQRRYLELSVVHTVGREIWVGYDSDNDGTLDKMLILDLQRDVRTRQLYDRAWRTYDYGVGFNDFVVVSSGNQFRKIYAADADNAYILELESGNLDHNLPIVGLLETHDLTAENLAMIHQLDIDASYPGSPPTYRITLTNHNGDSEVYDFGNIGGSDDIRGHRMGVRLRSPVSVRLQLEQWSTANDELRAITLGYTTK